MKYLVIGDAGSMHIYNFVRTVLLPRNYQVHLLTLSAAPVREVYRQFYAENGVIVHSVSEKGYSGLDKKDKLHRLLQLFYKFLLMFDVPRVDVCHVHSVYKTSMYLIRLFRHKYKKLILSYWGGDIENEPDKVNRLREKSFPRASCITVTVERTREQFREIYGKRYDDKLTVCRFATEGLECIRRLAQTGTREQFRREYRIPEGKICITCGYSAYAAQHQDECLCQIGMLSDELKQRIHVIVPMQYGRFDIPYIQRVKQAAEESGISYEILEEYVPFEKSAMLALATDIYLHVRDTDAFSNALKEHVYAGSVVIKGDWLIYRELDEMKANVTGISSLGELKLVLEEMLSGFEPAQSVELFSPMYELYSEQSVREQWYRVIDRTINS